jgi:hypothetical protein
MPMSRVSYCKVDRDMSKETLMRTLMRTLKVLGIRRIGVRILGEISGLLHLIVLPSSHYQAWSAETQVATAPYA